MSGPNAGVARPLPSDLVKQYRALLLEHGDDPSLGVCVFCQRHRCNEWQHAFTALVVAGELGGVNLANWQGSVTSEGVAV